MGKGSEDLGKKESLNSTPVNSDSFPAWARDVAECEENFGVSREKGLGTDEVLKRHQIYGLNELEKPEGTSIFKLILEQFNDTLVRILLAAAVISFVLAFLDGDEGGEMGITAFVEPLVIFLILIVNAIVGIWQETNAEKALEALKEIQSQQATVMRDGTKVSSLPAKELVPGDIVELRVGESDITILSAQVIAQQTVHKEESITHLQDVVGCDELGKVVNMLSGLSHIHQVWEPGGVLADHVLVNRLSAQVIGLDDSHLEQLTNNGLKTELKKVLKLKEPVELENQKKSRCFKSSDVQQQKRKFTKSWSFKYKSRLTKIKLPDTKLLWEKVYVVSCLSLDAQFHSLKFQLKHKWRSKHRHKFRQRKKLNLQLQAVLQAVLEQILQGDDEAYTKIFDKL